jgi:hypothetical protein
MPLYDIIRPVDPDSDSAAGTPDHKALKVTVSGPNWMEALNLGARHFGANASSTNDMMVSVVDARTVEVTFLYGDFALQITSHGDDIEATEGGGSDDTPEIVSISSLKSLEKPISGAITEHLRRMSGPATKPRTADFESMRPDLIMKCGDVARGGRALEEVLSTFLDLAMQYVRCDAGSIILKQVGRSTLCFAAARGPKARSILSLTVPQRVGLAGFVSHYGVALAVSDVERDTRFYNGISKKLNYPTRSLVAVPLMADGLCFGCLELINKLQNSTYTETELAVLKHIGLEIGLLLKRQLTVS